MHDAQKMLAEIIGRVKTVLALHLEDGLEPPPLSPAALQYLESGISLPASLDDLRLLMEGCRQCVLYGSRTNLVFGEGPADASLLFVGDAPGREDDQAGRPFAGEAGELLTRIIQNGMGLNKEAVYICNVVKCRLPGDRKLDYETAKPCLPFLKRQIELIGPQVICTLGEPAAQALVGKEFKLTLHRGKWSSYMGIPVMPTHHPAFILQNPSRERGLKSEVWQDVQKIMKVMGLEAKKRNA